MGMDFGARLEREWIYLSGLVRTLLRVSSIAASTTVVSTSSSR